MYSPPSDIKRFALHCEDGVAVRAELLHATETEIAAVVLCHPHPLHGGNMFSPVIGGLFTGLPARGITTLRFNFRGTSGSEGRHDGGKAERLDVAAAIDHLRGPSSAAPPIVLVGYSFGAAVGLTVTSPAVAGWVAIAPPLSMTSLESMRATAQSPKPKQLIIGADDNFCPPELAAKSTVDWTTTTITTLADQDHFLATAGPDLLELVDSAVAAQVGEG